MVVGEVSRCSRHFCSRGVRSIRQVRLSFDAEGQLRLETTVSDLRRKVWQDGIKGSTAAHTFFGKVARPYLPSPPLPWVCRSITNPSLPPLSALTFLDAASLLTSKPTDLATFSADVGLIDLTMPGSSGLLAASLSSKHLSRRFMMRPSHASYGRNRRGE